MQVLYFADDKDESQRGPVVCSRSQLAKLLAELQLKPGLMSLHLDLFISFGISLSLSLFLSGNASTQYLEANTIRKVLPFRYMGKKKSLILILLFLNCRE